MKRQIRMWILLVLTLCTIMFLGACAKKVAPPPPPAPPSAQPPTASLAANPNTINAGDSTTLTWQTTNATDVSIDGIGTVDTSGSRQVTPAASTTYHLTAKGAGGSQDATARVTVSAPAPPEQPAAPNLTEQELFAQNVKDIYFDYDKADVRPSDQSTIQADAQFLQQHSAIHITVEGYCDERGSTEKRARAGWNQRRPHQDLQLRQRKTVLHRIDRKLLAAESPRPFGLREITTCIGPICVGTGPCPVPIYPDKIR